MNLLTNLFSGNQVFIDRFIGWKSIVIAFVMAIFPICRILGFIPEEASLYIYYGSLATGATYAFFNLKHIMTAPTVMIAVCILSILIGNPAPVFSSWTRLGLFLMVILSVFPLLQSDRLMAYRGKITFFTLWIIVAVSVGSLIAFFLGINYMRLDYNYVYLDLTEAGIFGGLTTHSMVLGPISGVAIIFLIWRMTCINKGLLKITISLLMCVACIAALFLSASRGALVATAASVLIVIYLKSRHKWSNLMNAFLVSVLLFAVFSPVIIPFTSGVIEKQQINIQSGSTFFSREAKWNNRWEEFIDNPFFGVGFSAMDPKNTEDYFIDTGVNEPGSSWLAILSMTGIIGFITFFYLVFFTYKRLWKMAGPHNKDSILILGVFSLFLIHLIIEGYIYAAGSYLCYLFWLIFGNGLSLAHKKVAMTRKRL